MVYTIVKRIVASIVTTIAKLWIRKIIGLENIPRDRPFIIAANHGSYLDDFSLVPIVGINLKKRTHMYCNDRFYKNKLFGAFLNWADCIPISIQTKKPEVNKEAFRLALEYLKKGEPVGIFPEGGRSLDGNLREAKTGIAKLALVSKIPVLPIGIVGSYDVFPKGAKFPKFKRFDIKIGELIYFDKFFGDEDNKKVLKEVTTLIMRDIAKLVNKEYKY